MLDVKLVFDPPEGIFTPALATWVFQPQTPTPLAPEDALANTIEDLDRWADESPAVPPLEPRLEYALAAFDAKVGGQLSTLAAAGELTGKPGETLLLHHPHDFKAQRLLLVGAGKPQKFTLDSVRSLAGAAARFLKARG
ncbi:MAG: M17 family peptidase N-terminal domain-containing protein, partial [Candidatus Acidiferrales bacterium]